MENYESLKKQIEEMQAEKKKEEQLEKFLKTEDAKVLPVDLVKRLITCDEEVTKSNIEALKKALNPEGAPLEKFNKNPWMKDNFNLTLQGKILSEYPELAKKYIDEARK